MIVSKTIQECEKLAGKSITSTRKVVNDVLFVVPIEKDGDILQMEVHADTFLTSKKPIGVMNTAENTGSQLPDIFPLKYTISMPQQNIYQLRDIYRKYDGNKLLLACSGHVQILCPSSQVTTSCFWSCSYCSISIIFKSFGKKYFLKCHL